MKEGWTYKKLGDLCKVLNGLWVGKKEPFVNIAVIRNTNFSKDCKLKLDDVAYIDVEEKQFSTRKLQVGDIIIEKSGGSDKQPVGRPVLFNIPDGDYSFSNFTATLRLTDKNITPKFLHQCLYGYYRNGETKRMQSKTTGLHNLDMKAYLRLPIPFFSLSEQERIVSELDLLSSIIEKKKEQLKAYDQLAQSIFYDMFGDPIENEKGWEVKKIGSEFEVSSGGTPSTKNNEYWVDGGISWIGSNMCQNKVIRENDGKFITKQGLEHSNAKLYEKGYVLIALVGATIGKVALLQFKTTTNQNIAGINVPANRDFVPFFVFYVIQSLYCLFENIGDGKFKMANLSFVRSLPIIAPPLSLQQTFASKIEAIEKQKSLIQQSIAETQTLFDSRMDYYFS